MSGMDEREWPEDPAVADVERILAQATRRSPAQVSTRDGKAMADRAVWFCVCSGEDDTWDPSWAVYDTDDGRLGWCRVPDGVEIGSVVDAPRVTGDHVAAIQVLDWATAEAPDPWPGYAPSESEIIHHVGRTVRRLAAS